jgi:hypothetical protein
MVSFESESSCCSALFRCVIALALMSALGPLSAQQTVPGFAVERFYPSAPGVGWFVMDDLNIGGKLSGAIEVSSGYARNPLTVATPNGTQQLALVTNQAFVDIGGAVTYDRYRIYLNFPIPCLVEGNGGAIGSYQLNAPGLSAGTHPDTIADPRIGFDVRVLGKQGKPFRLGVGAQLMLPSGDRASYVSDARYRGMFRFLAAGDAAGLSYAGQLGIHIRPLNEAFVLGSPHGDEFLFGGAAGRRISGGNGWTILVGPEIFGETAQRAFFSREQTALETLMTLRFERISNGSNLRIKAGIGHGLVQRFGAPQWRLLVAFELFGQHSTQGN